MHTRRLRSGATDHHSTSTGSHKLNFEACDRTDPQSPTDCMQHLSHSWITTAPLVFGQYVAGTSDIAGRR